MNAPEHQILTRIGFAERWLQRAREECLDGDVARGLLTLVLADAEVRRVLQLAVPPAPRRRGGTVSILAVTAACVIALMGALQLGVLALGAVPTQSVALPPGLALRPGTGALLEPLQAAPLEPERIGAGPALPAPVVPAAAASSSVRRSAAVTVPMRPVAAGVPAVASPMRTPAAAVPTSPSPAPVQAAAPAPPQDPIVVLSGADLLDLVIIADRALRRSQP